MKFSLDFELKEDGSIVQLKKQVKGLGDESRKTAKSEEKLSKETTKVGKVAGVAKGGVSKLKGTLIKLAGAFTAAYLASKTFSATFSGISSLAQTGMEMEKLKVTLNGLYGGAEQGEAAFQKIIQLSNETPFSIEQVTQSMIKMKAYGMDTKYMTDWSDQAAGMGKSVDQVVEAIADAQTGDYERLKEAFGIKAMKEGGKTILNFKDQFGETRHWVVQGSEEMEAALSKIARVKFGGAGERLAQTFAGKLSNLETQWTIFKDKIANDSGLMDVLKGSIDEISASFKEMTESEDAMNFINGLVQDIVLGLIDMSMNAIEFGNNFINAWNGIGIVAMEVIAAIKNGIMELESAVSKFTISPMKNLIADFADMASKELDHKGLAQTAKNIRGEVSSITEKIKKNDEAIITNSKTFINETKKIIKKAGEREAALVKIREKHEKIKNTVKKTFEEYKKGGDKAKKSNEETTKSTEKLGDAGRYMGNKSAGGFKKHAAGSKAAKGGVDKLAKSMKDASMEQKNMLRNDLEYFRAVKDFAGAESTEKKLYHDRLMEQGFSKQRMMEMEAVQADKLKEKYKDLATQELESQTNLMAGVDQYLNNLQERMTKYNEYTKGILLNIESVLNDSFNEFFDGTSKKFLDLKELGRSVMTDVLKYIQQMITKMIIMKTMSMITGAFSGGGGGGGFMGMFANGAAFGQSGQIHEFANGGAFTNQIFDNPTPFQFGGGNLGVMGEAGKEAVIPLSEKNGVLGVRMDEGGQGGAINMQVVINNNSGQKLVASQTGPNELTIENFDAQMSQRIKQGKSETGKILESKYNMERR